MELKSIIGLAERGRAIPCSWGGAQPQEGRRRAAGGLLRAAACAGGLEVPAGGEESPCIFRVNKKKLSDFSRLTKLG